MKELTDRLRGQVLPDCFEIDCETVSFDNPDDLKELLKTREGFMALVGEKTSVGSSKAWVDTYESGFLASIALSLWFMEFDEDNWFSFEKIHDVLADFFKGRKKYGERIELRLVRGDYPPMMLDQPVLVDMAKNEISFLFGKLND